MTNEFCKHYRGMHLKNKCEAGVAFSDLPNYGTDLFHDSCPCFGSDHSGECDRKEYPTAEEIAVREAELKARFAATVKARTAIIEHLGGPWNRGMDGSSGEIDCPVCNGKDTLLFSRSGYNGHMHARCKTEDCVSWME